MPSYHDKLTDHFIAGELGAERAPAIYLPNIQRTADYLEVIRAELGVPLGRVSGWRSPQRNEIVGGSKTSSHLTGDAADFTPLGRGVFSSYNQLKVAKAAKRLPTFDQIIYYPFGHLHVGLGPRNRNEFRIRISEAHYALDTDLVPPVVESVVTAVATSIPSTISLGVVLAVTALAILIIIATL